MLLVVLLLTHDLPCSHRKGQDLDEVMFGKNR